VQRFPEISFEEFDVIQRGADRWLFVRRVTGEEYRPVYYEPSGDGAQGIVAFTVDDGGRVHFLRQRGEST
jgi:hypothetical protein